MQIRSTLPPILPHTEAKHHIFTHHMSAWFPILGRYYDRLQFIDGFSGPGEYQGGEIGSPIRALNVVASHWFSEEYFSVGKQFDFLFIDKNPSHVEHLKRKISETSWPSSFNVEVRNEEFEDTLTNMLDEIEDGKRSMPPTLLFIDPFGSAGFPMELLGRVAKHDRIDILINFNWLDLNRWLLRDPTKYVVLDKLYGSPRWRPALRMNGDTCKNFLIKEYGDALHEIGWRGTNFEMINGQNQTQYYLFFGTGSPRGMGVIKKAMRSASPDGQFRYMDRSDPLQHRLIGTGMEVEYAGEISDHLFHKYRGIEASKEALIEDNIDWHPRWVESDLTAALRLLEGFHPPKITKVRNLDGRNRRKGSYPSGCIITFADFEQSTLL